MFASLAQAVAGDEYSDEEVKHNCLTDTVTVVAKPVERSLEGTQSHGL
jgi:hypothetical protein